MATSGLPASTVRSSGCWDVHAHFLPAELTAPAGGGTWPVLEIDPAGRTGRIMLGDTVFRKVRAPLWDVPARLVELDEAGIEVQVISPVPITLSHDAAAGPAAAYLRAQNDLLADAVARSGGRLLGFGAVAVRDVAAAVAEVARLAALPGMVGVELGTFLGGREFDDPELWPLFAAVEQHDLALFVHPTHQATAIRRSGDPYTFGLGMHTDTAMAGAALVFGGVLERFPRLRVCLAHGCGSLAWSYPRLRYGAGIAARQAGEQVDLTRLDELLRRLWCDTLVFAPEHLSLLAVRFGPEHLLVGTDHPFMPSPLGELIDVAARSGAFDEAALRAIHRDNAAAFLPAASRTRA